MGKKINDDWVIEYGVSMLDPSAAFPGPILNKLKHITWILSGNHRVCAAKSIGESVLDAYVIDGSKVDPRVLDVLPRVVNTWEGHPLSRDEKLAQAAHMVQAQGMEVKEACRLFSLQYPWLVTYMRTSQLAEDIRAQGVNPLGLSKSMLLKLSPFSSDKSTLGAIAKFFKKNEEHLKQDDQLQIIDDLKEVGTEKDRIQVLRDWGETVAARQERKPVPFATKTRSRFLEGVTRLRNFLVGVEEPTQLQLHPEDIERVMGYWREIETKMNQLLKKGGA